MFIVIPAYQPDVRLVGLVSELRDALPGTQLLVVDDGSGADFGAVFDAVSRLGAMVIAHPVNRGKGEALKLGFEYVRRAFPGEDVVTADADGQHRVDDIARVAQELCGQERPTLVLGARTFSGAVPWRSRCGNALARAVFRFTTGLAVHDTQTGLRGYPAELLAWACDVQGERFEYELAVLLEAASNSIPVREIEVDTVYFGANAGSHFRPISDSLRAFRPLLSFSAVSLLTFLLDFIAVLSVNAVTGDLLLSVVLARLFSGSVNFVLNRKLVFGAHEGSPAGQVLRYLLLAVVLMASSYGLLSVLTSLGLSLAPAKLLSDSVLYLASYTVQRVFVFRRRPTLSEGRRAAAARLVEVRDHLVA